MTVEFIGDLSQRIRDQWDRDRATLDAACESYKTARREHGPCSPEALQTISNIGKALIGIKCTQKISGAIGADLSSKG